MGIMEFQQTLSPRIRCDTWLSWPVPAGWTPEDAATVPLAYAMVITTKTTRNGYSTVNLTVPVLFCLVLLRDRRAIDHAERTLPDHSDHVRHASRGPSRRRRVPGQIARNLRGCRHRPTGGPAVGRVPAGDHHQPKLLARTHTHNPFI